MRLGPRVRRSWLLLLRSRSPLLRACADRLATFHICRFSERLNGLLIAHWHIRYPPIRAASYSPKCLEVEFCEVRAATTTALPNGASLFALFFVRLQDHRRAVAKSKCVG